MPFITYRKSGWKKGDLERVKAKKKTIAKITRKKNPTYVNHYGGRFYNKKDLLNIGPFPKRMTRWHKYTEVFNQTTTTPGVVYQYEINGLYDPRYSVGGHQPLFRDTLAGIYDNYKVYKCLVEFTVVCRTSNAKFFMALHALGGDAANYPTSAETAIEKPGVKWRYVDGTMTGKLRCLYKMSDVFGITDSQIHNGRAYGAGQGANPSTSGTATQYGVYLTPLFWNADESTSTDFTVCITLYQKATWRTLDYEVQN